MVLKIIILIIIFITSFTAVNCAHNYKFIKTYTRYS